MSVENKNASNLLHRLSSADPGPAWAEFLDQFNGLIMATINQFEHDTDRRDDCFLHVCEKLCDHECKRLLSFDTTGDASFSHWLSTVVFNLCVDWHRAEYGRATVIPAIAALPAFDRMVYRMCHEQGQSRDECFQFLKADFPELTVEGVTNSLQRIHRLLTPRQRWQIGVRGHRRLGTQPGSMLSAYEHAFDPGAGPESLAADDEKTFELQAALRHISPEHRLLLHLRFQEGLTFQQISVIGDYGNARRARRQVKGALDQLQLSLSKQQRNKNRKT